MKKPLCGAILTVTLAIALALCLLPATSLADSLSRLYIGNSDVEIQLPSNGRYTYGTNTAVSAKNVDTLPDSGWVWAVSNTSDAYTLILNNATLERNHLYSTGVAGGIYASGDLTLELRGVSTVKGADVTESGTASYGVYLSQGSLAVNGSGELTATGGTSADGYSYGILIHNDLTVTGNSSLKGVSSAAGGNCYGMDIGGKLSVSDAGLVRGFCNPDSDTDHSTGISMGSLEVSGIASVQGVSGSLNGDSYGLDVVGTTSGSLISVSGGIVKGISGVSTNWNSIGVNVRGSTGSVATVTVSGGSLRGESDYATFGKSRGMSFTDCSYTLSSGNIVAASCGAGTDKAPESLPSSYYYRMSSADGFSYVPNDPDYDWDISHPIVDIRTNPTTTAAVGEATVSGTANAPISSTVVVVALTNANFKSLSMGEDVSAWFTNLPVGLSAKVRSIDGTAVRLVLSGTPTVASTEPMSITLPEGVVSADFSGSSNITVAANPDAKWSIAPAPTATVSNVTVSGTANAPIAPASVTLTLTRASFKALNAGADVSAWFTNLPAGLTANIQTAVAADATTATVAISGTPTAGSSIAMTVTLPPADVTGTAADIVAVANPAAKWDISPAPVPPVPPVPPEPPVPPVPPVQPPKTGDAATPALWLVLMLATLGAAGCIAVAARKRRRT